jgi:uncharacterized protein (TIGR03437 family)
VLNFSVDSQPSFGATPREARLTVSNQTITVRQRGRASAVSAASFNTLLAAEAITSVFGTNIAKETKVAESTPLPTALGGASVLVEDSRAVRRNAPLFFVSSGQNNFQIPPGTATGSGLVIVTIDGQEYADSRVNITSSAPGNLHLQRQRARHPDRPHPPRQSRQLADLRAGRRIQSSDGQVRRQAD